MSKKKICGAKTKSGKPCRSKPMPNGRCRMHGGASLKGAEHPNYNHGRYSKYVPTALLGRYGEMAADPEALSLREDIALASARVSELLEGLKATAPMFEELLLAKSKMIAASETGNEDAARKALERIFELIDEGSAIEPRWQLIQAANEKKRRLVETESRRIADADEILTRAQVLALMIQMNRVVMDLADRYVPKKKQAAFKADFTTEITTTPVLHDGVQKKG